MADPYKEYDYLMECLVQSKIDLLEEALQIVEGFPDGVDGFVGRNWITNAIDSGSLESVKWILSKGVDLSFRDPEGYTPLLSAMDRGLPGKYEIIQLLINHGAPINRKGINDWTPLHLAAVREDLEALQILLKNGADASIRTEIDGYATPLEEARSLGKLKSVAFLESAV